MEEEEEFLVQVF